VSLLVLALVGLGEPIPVRTHVEGETVLVLLEADTPIGRIEADGAARILSVEASEDALSWRPVDVDRLPIRARALRLRLRGGDGGVRVFAPAETIVVRVTDFRAEAGENEATVRYRTSFPVSTAILYGFDLQSLQQSAIHSPDRRTDHAVTLPALLPGTAYEVWVLVDGRPVGVGRDRPFEFTTAGTPFPRVVRTEVLERGTDRLKIRFRTNVPTTARLAWGERVDAVLRSDRRGTTHVFDVPALRPRTEYVYHVVLEDAGGRKMTMPAATVRTDEANVGRGRPVDGTFTHLAEGMTPGPVLPRVTDGRLDYFEGMATSGDPGETDQWVRLDLGSSLDVEEIEVIWRGNAYARAFVVAVGATPDEARYPGGPFDAAEGEFSRSERGDPLRHVRVPVRDGPVRFITIFVPRGSGYQAREGWRFVQLAEVKAHLRPGPAHRSASAQRTHDMHGGAE
jgi:hypothetical protein